MQFRYGILVCDFGMELWYTILVCNFGMQFRYGIMVCNFGMQFWYAISVWNFGMQPWYEILVCNYGMQFWMYRILSFPVSEQTNKECWCGDYYGKHGESERCTDPCPGDSDAICGGLWSNSVFDTSEWIHNSDLYTDHSAYVGNV